MLILAFLQENAYPKALRTLDLSGRGAVAQLGERFVRNEEASGSIPLSSTNFINKINRLRVI